MAGDAAIKFETDTKEESLARVMTILRQIWEPKLGKGKVPNPIQAACTRWSSDPFSCGSYSSAALGSSVSDFDELAKPFDRLFFAGEATTSKWPATMHGALFTGFREASRIARYLGNNPLLLDLKTIPVVDRDGEESDDEGGNNNDDAPSDAVAVNSDDIEDEDEEVAGDGERLLKLSQDLKEMVASREPDLLFGCFSAYFAPTSPDPASTPAPLLPSGDVAGPSPASRTDTETTQPASSTDDGLCLVRVDLALSLGGCDGEREDDSSVPVFLAISKSDVYNLQDIKGDSERLLVLRNPLGLGINLEKRSGSLSDSALVKAREQVGRGKTIKRTRPAVLRLLLDLILKSPMSQISQE